MSENIEPELRERARQLALDCRKDPFMWENYTDDPELLVRLKRSGLNGQTLFLARQLTSCDTQTTPLACPPQQSAAISHTLVSQATVHTIPTPSVLASNPTVTTTSSAQQRMATIKSLPRA